MNFSNVFRMLWLIPLTGTVVCMADSKPSSGGKPGKAPPAAAMAMQLPAVLVEPVGKITSMTPREYIGNVEAIEEVALPSRITGAITGIEFSQGSLVKQGDLLFTIEDTSYRAKVMAAAAKVKQEEAELKYAVSNYQRQKRLATTEAVSRSNYEDAERLVEATQARYEHGKAALLEAENELGYTRILAPISGRIGEVKYTRGNVVNPSSGMLAKIVSVNPVRVKFSVSERDFLNLFKNINDPNPNLEISLRLSNNEPYAIPGKIAFIDNMVDENTGTVAIWTEFENPDMKLIPGGYATVLLAEKMAQPAPGVRLSAIMTDSLGSFVYVVGKDGMPVRRDVTVGGVVGDYAVVTALEEGELVITDGTHKIIPGVPVSPVMASGDKE